MRLAGETDFRHPDKRLLVVLQLGLRLPMSKTVHLVGTVGLINEVSNSTSACCRLVLLLYHFDFGRVLFNCGPVFEVFLGLSTWSVV